MILALVPLAVAALPWDCPALDVPADGLQFKTDGGISGIVGDLEGEAWAWDDGCGLTNGTSESVGRNSCTTSAGATLTYAWTRSNASDSSESTWSLEVTLPEGTADWTWLRVEGASSSYMYGISSSSRSTTGASWIGTPGGLPADASVSYLRLEWVGMGQTGLYIAGEAGTCTWFWGTSDDWTTMIFEEEAGNADHWTRVQRESSCRWDGHTYATYDGVLWGAVHATTWALDEVDLDGWSVADGDCDDADPLRFPCAEETAGDGVDSDCNGVDETDLDGDGHDAPELGGDDCDDDAYDVHPGADDRAGDGVDRDCDGHDDVDADRDGFTEDGDDQAADCHDADAAAFPGAREIAGDGLDQDCDGADDVDADTDGYTVDGDDRDADCADGDAAVHPGATDVACDGIDQDCDGADPCDTPDTAVDTGTEDTGEPAHAASTDDGDDTGGCGAGGSMFLFLIPPLARRRRRRP